MIPESEITEIQVTQESYLYDRISIERDIVVAPDMEGPEIIARGVKARITAGYGTFRDVAERFQGITPYTITVPVDTDATPGDRFIDENSDHTYLVRDTKDQGALRSNIVCLGELVH